MHFKKISWLLPMVSVAGTKLIILPIEAHCIGSRHWILRYKSEVLTYPEAIQYMFDRLPMFHRIGVKAYKKDLSRTLAMCERLGNPQTKLQCIHIAGTNGKGSVSHMLAAALQQHGYSVGLYTSPHYRDFRERIKINGTYIEKRFVSGFISEFKSIISTSTYAKEFFSYFTIKS